MPDMNPYWEYNRAEMKTSELPLIEMGKNDWTKDCDSTSPEWSYKCKRSRYHTGPHIGVGRKTATDPEKSFVIGVWED